MQVSLSIKVLPRQSEIASEVTNTVRVLIRRIVPKRIVIVPPPHRRAGSIGDQSWGIEVIRMNEEHPRRCIGLNADGDRGAGGHHPQVVRRFGRQRVIAHRHPRPGRAVRCVGERHNQRGAVEELHLGNRAIVSGRGRQRDVRRGVVGGVVGRTGERDGGRGVRKIWCLTPLHFGV